MNKLHCKSVGQKGSSGYQTWSKAGQERWRMGRRRVDGEREGDGYDILLSYSIGAEVQEAEKEEQMSMRYGHQSRDDVGNQRTTS